MAGADRSTQAPESESLGTKTKLSGAPPLPHAGTQSLFSEGPPLRDSSKVIRFSYSPAERRLVAWSGDFLAVLGAPEASLLRDANIFLRHAHPDDRFGLLQALEHALAGANDYRVLYRWIRPDRNESRTLLCHASSREAPARDAAARGLSPSPKPLVLDGFIVDISDLVARPNQAGEQSLPPLLRLFSDTPSLFFIIDRDLRLAEVNREVKSPSPVPAADSSGRDDTSELIALDDFDFGDPMLDHARLKVGRPILDAFSTETLRLHFARVFEQLLSGAQTRFSTRLSTGEIPQALHLIPLYQDGDRDSQPIGILGMVSSLREYAALERQLMELRKAESLRSLASGVSHHVNNALQGILGQASLLQSHSDDPSIVQREAKGIADLVQRASELLRQLFLFDEGGGSRDSAVDLNLAVMTAMSSLDEFFRSPLQLQVSFGNPLPILAPPPVVQALIKDLLHIASEYVLQDRRSSSASQDTDLASALALKTAHCREAPAEVRGLRRGVCSQLLVEQFVPRPLTREAIEDPDQSASPPSSLPLRRLQALRAVSSSPQFRRAQQSASRLGGAITATLSPSAALSLSLYLPATEAEQQNLFVVDESAHPEVLIVDDDQTVASTIEQLLKDFGYDCVVAQSGSRALAVSHAYKHSLRLLLLDAIMPGEDSVELLRTMRQTHPHLRIVGFTGAGSEISDTLRAAGAEQVLRKPIDPQLLKDTLRTLLRSASAANT